MQQGKFSRVGVYGSLYLGDLNLIGVAVHGSDDLSLRDDETDAEISLTTRTYDAWFAQADYVITPPFQVSAPLRESPAGRSVGGHAAVRSTRTSASSCGPTSS